MDTATTQETAESKVVAGGFRPIIEDVLGPLLDAVKDLDIAEREIADDVQFAARAREIVAEYRAWRSAC